MGIDYLALCRDFLKKHDSFTYPLLAASYRYGPYHVKNKHFNIRQVKQPKSEIYKQCGVVGAVCHGPAALVGAEIDGMPLVAGKRVASFTNAEEDAVELTEAMPFLLETRLKELGAEFVAGENFQTNVVVDERLVTGLNPASAEKAAEAIIEILNN